MSYLTVLVTEILAASSIFGLVLSVSLIQLGQRMQAPSLVPVRKRQPRD
jgi:hypothetical protein